MGVRPGQREVVVATKEVVHGKPATELGMTGVARKCEQPPPMAPNADNAVIAQTIVEDEEFVLFLGGTEEDILVADLPAGAAVGDPLYITVADNTLADEAEALTAGAMEAAYLKFGRIVDINTTTGRAAVNLNVKAELPG